jgi:hypothetical protein
MGFMTGVAVGLFLRRRPSNSRPSLPMMCVTRSAEPIDQTKLVRRPPLWLMCVTMPAQTKKVKNDE